ncbi:hypothetical protein CONLIGDRAFT_62368 [Coniochaeta ligniaria NRRL 30616]|uniref:Uncharacterized protein n=1 Tax=Coniochaeta ligniaria NRRL 30616 TaxID=1408157 RepID=A0A1J7K1E0_9PEZI|nr:hypothetical protein CONLIGDRAFT_62368 [Coniochaeta ligniaria NRRL 30616]
MMQWGNPTYNTVPSAHYSNTMRLCLRLIGFIIHTHYSQHLASPHPYYPPVKDNLLLTTLGLHLNPFTLVPVPPYRSACLPPITFPSPSPSPHIFRPSLAFQPSSSSTTTLTTSATTPRVPSPAP